jgi:hypothetical protein
MAVVEQDENVDGTQEVLVEEKARYMRPGQCRSYMRKTLAKEFKGIVDGFVAAAKEGSCPHLKLATELLKPVRKSPSRKKGPVAKYWEQLEKEQLEKERTEKKSRGSE